MLVNKKVINREKFYMFVFPDAADVKAAEKRFNVATFKTETPDAKDVDQFFAASIDADKMPEDICDLVPVESSSDPDALTVLRGEMQSALTGLSDRISVLEALRAN